MNLGCLGKIFKINEEKLFFPVIHYTFLLLNCARLTREICVQIAIETVHVECIDTFKVSALDTFLLVTDLLGIADKFIWLSVRSRCYR